MNSSAEKSVVASASYEDVLDDVRRRLSRLEAQGPGSGSEKLPQATAEKVGRAVDDLFDLLSTVVVAPAPQANDREVSATRADFGNTSVLLVEDNTVNRMVAEGMLRQFHCSIDIAENGAEAVKRFGECEYDLIFMDCQMPVMDGFEAVAKIREIENVRARSSSCDISNGNTLRTPIVALTANALKGDREKCVAAGMDDYVSKPFSVSDLEQALSRRLGVERTRKLRVLSEAATSDDTASIDAGVDSTLNSFCPIIDVTTLDTIRSLTKTDGQQLLNRVVEVFLSTSPKLVNELSSALASGTASSIVSAAHALRSSCGCVGAARLARLCQSIENRGDGGSDGVAEEFSEQLRVRHEEVCNELRENVLEKHS